MILANHFSQLLPTLFVLTHATRQHITLEWTLAHRGSCAATRIGPRGLVHGGIQDQLPSVTLELPYIRSIQPCHSVLLFIHCAVNLGTTAHQG